MEPWFDEQTAGIIGGILGSVIGIWGGGVLGGMSSFYINKGLKKLAYWLWGVTFFAELGVFMIGLIALILKQPFYVWWVFVFLGGLSALITGAVFPVVRKRFAEREKQIMAIEDL